VARPTVLSRERIAMVALRILDEEGLDALSVERIARELGVRGPSIYHHFSSKADIIHEVARIVLGDLEMRRTAPDWKSWMAAVCVRFYQRVVEHPRSAAILLEYLPDMAAIPAFGVASRYLTRQGVSPTVQVLVMEGTEKIAWGWSMRRAIETMNGIPSPPDDEERLEEALHLFMEGVIARERERIGEPA
jgi:AcrR family transcriptional regulator